MRRLILAATAAIAALTVLLTGTQFIEPVRAATNLAVHVHDSYYHPAGAFNTGSGTNHSLAMAFCQAPNPDLSCDAHIAIGDTITWVSPSPFAQLVHTVTECTDNTFTLCGPSVAPNNPIGDSGFRAPPMPGPSGWPYGPITFTQGGTNYYRCEVHPDTMRGRIVVDGPVGGSVEILGGGLSGDNAAVWVLGVAGAIVLLAGTGGVLAAQRIRRREESD